ncbi:hypothetical protein RSAG8_05472, partial [Rhizoctonia solani AG-8 WAC10335]
MNAARSSPVKARGAYESKHIAREMDRLGVGVGSGIPSANTSTLSLPLTSQPLPSIAGGGSILNSTTSDTAPYQELHVHVLPLFNSENLKLPIEELNGLVKQHIQAVISRGPSRARAVLEQDVKDLVNMGMITLNAKLQGLEEETLLTRVVQIWGFFWDQVLLYLEGVFLPLQTEKILQNLARNTKTVRPGSPGSPAHDLPGVVPLVGCPTIDVRNVVLQSFRDSIIQPIWQKLYDQLLAMGKDVSTLHARWIDSGLGQPLPSIAGGGSILNSTTSDTAPYQELHVHVLPLFNSENLKLPIEELNGLVKQHIQAVISRGPSRARAVLEQDVKDLVNMGMITLNAKLQGLEEETLLTRVVQIWGFFWDQVLPYLEGVFLPLQTEKILQNLARNTKTVRPGSPGSPAHDLPGVVPLVGCPTIDVRNVVLQSFRDSIIQPIWQKLYDQLLAMGKDVDASASLGDRSARLQQMLLVLSSASSRSILLSQSSQLSPMNPGEEAVTHLLRAILRVRALASSRGAQSHQRLPPPPALGFGGPSAGTGAAGMLFGAAPRDRRGRIAHKEPPQRDGMVFSDDADGDVFAPPGPRDEIEVQERQFLDSLKSPVPQSEVGPGSPENKKPTTRAPEQADTRGLGFATAMRAVI